MAKDIKQKNVLKDIRTLDKVSGLKQKTGRQLSKAKENLEKNASLSDSPDNETAYANKKISDTAKESNYAMTKISKRIEKTMRQKSEDKSVQIKTKEYVRRVSTKRQQAKAEGSGISKTSHQNASIVKAKNAEIKSKNITPKTVTNNIAAHSKKNNIHSMGRKKAVRENANRVMAKNASKKKTTLAAKRTKDALAKMVRAIAASLRSLVAAIGAGSALVVFIVVFIIIIGAILSSSFGVFFSNDDGDGLKMKDVVAQLNDEFTAEIKKVETGNPHDEMEIIPAGEYINWKEVIAIYACKVTESMENPLDVVSIDDTRVALLRAIMFDMNKISQTVKSETTEKEVKSTDDKGKEITTTETVTTKKLIITITHKSAEEMADAYFFTKSQKTSLAELLDPANDKLWTELLGGAGFADADIGGGAKYTGGRMGWPANGPVTSRFGPRWGRMHNGLDIGVPTNSPIFAASDGTISMASWNGSYGNCVIINHGGGLSTLYAHNNSFTVSVGQKVKRGEQIAKSGSTGRSTGPHCHFEVRVNGTPQNPETWLLPKK